MEQQLEKILGISFNNKALLREALTHRSYLNEHPSLNISSNERLEFLGDAILEFLISRILFEQFLDSTEGILTAFRSQVVRTKTLAMIAQKLRLGEYLYLSKGEEMGEGRRNSGLLENCLEALIGAIFKDQGIEKSEEFVRKFFLPVIKSLKLSDLKDPKSLIQEQTQQKEKITPTYKVLFQTGPDHAKIFSVGIFLGKEKIAQGQGSSKQEAEEDAARQALKKYVT